MDLTIDGPHGWPIACRLDWDGQERVVVVCHGFGSSKDSIMGQALARTAPGRGLGVLRFDFPAHGDSPVWEDGLRVPYCLDDLAAVEDWVHARAPGTEVVLFGSSFGAYLALLYLAARPRAGARAFLRSAAVTMPQLVAGWIDDRARADLARQGWFRPDYDYVREMRLSQAFLDDLAAHDVFTAFRPGLASVRMAHGRRDTVAPFADVARFAARFGADLHAFPQGDHHLMGPGEAEAVLALALSFFLGEKY